MGSAFRVLQAGDFRLDEPLYPVGALPADLREILVQARERSALRVFDAAIEQRADLLLLTGQLADFPQEPRLACFFFHQLQRLRTAGAVAVWAVPEHREQSSWPELDNLIFPLYEEPLRVALSRHGRACVLQRKTALAAASGMAEDIRITLSSSGIVAVGTPGNGGAITHPVGNIQSAGPHSTATGMWLTEVPPGGTPACTRLDTETVHWVTESLVIDSGSTWASLLEQFAATMSRWSATPAGELTLIQWRVSGAGHLWDDLIGQIAAERLRDELRGLHVRYPHTWSWRVELHPDEEQYAVWTGCPPVALGLAELEALVRSGDLPELSSPNASSWPAVREIPEQSVQDLKRQIVRALRVPAGRSTATDGTH